MSNQLDTITIEGHPIIVIPEEELVLIRPICEAIGISFGSQRNRLGRQPWATVSIMNTVAPDGSTREQVVLPRAQVPMWLATITVNKVKDPRAREVLILFQKRCAEVLDAYWNKRAYLATNDMIDGLDFSGLYQLMTKIETGYRHQWPDRLESKTGFRRAMQRIGVVHVLEDRELCLLAKRRETLDQPTLFAAHEMIANDDQAESLS